MTIERRSAPMTILSLARSKSSMSTRRLFLRAAKSAASLTRLARSAPEKPGVPRAMISALTSGATGTFLMCTNRICSRPRISGSGTTTCRSNLPGRKSAGSSTSGRLVAAMTITPVVPSKPSISTRSWLSVCSRSSLPPPRPAPRSRPTALHLAHKEDPHADEEQHREPRHEDVHEERRLFLALRLDLDAVLEQIRHEPDIAGRIAVDRFPVGGLGLEVAAFDHHLGDAPGLDLLHELRIVHHGLGLLARVELVEHRHQDEPDDEPDHEILEEVIQLASFSATFSTTSSCCPF